jgi:hypothetical protein
MGHRRIAALEHYAALAAGWDYQECITQATARIDVPTLAP